MFAQIRKVVLYFLISLDDGKSKKTEQVMESVERIDDDCDTRE
jgi:hypothetical protein